MIISPLAGMLPSPLGLVASYQFFKPGIVVISIPEEELLVVDILVKVGVVVIPFVGVVVIAAARSALLIIHSAIFCNCFGSFARS